MYVCNGAKLKCSMGDSDSDLQVIHFTKTVKLDGQFMANIQDYKPIANIKPLGKCKSLGNPIVAAATAANYGRLQKMPCIPNTVSPWMPGKPNVLIKGQPALMDSDKLTCIWGGIIEITDSGQNDAEHDTVDSCGHDFDARGFGNLFDINFSL